ncbi:biliverdin-producing heme oxygenase [Spirosoma aerolatum]|uniref:biliverdin-producing heme oxygenase n=1 Tax=Spirosoma aerolatum TaxID=1211326 RepID=UPI001472C4F5|nr:biliverdin-producing heme oxygenase [Spirosoma aerolatum]
MMTLLERLRYETQPLHRQTETLFYTDDLQNGSLSTDQYTHLLYTHLHFHQGLEAAIDRYPDFFQDYNPDTRRKTAWLLSDLDYLNVPILPAKSDLFREWSPASLLGAAYVGEGSMLGGTVIWKWLQNNMAIEPLLTHARFFQGYGPATGASWKQFGAFLTSAGANHADDVVAGAKQAFINYQTLFRSLSGVRLPSHCRA